MQTEKKEKSRKTRNKRKAAMVGDYKNADLNFLFIICRLDVCSDCMMALCVQTLTGTAEKRTPRMERTHCVIQCSSQDPLELERLLRSTLVPRSWASRYKSFKVHHCNTCVGFHVLIS